MLPKQEPHFAVVPRCRRQLIGDLERIAIEREPIDQKFEQRQTGLHCAAGSFKGELQAGPRRVVVVGTEQLLGVCDQLARRAIV